MIIQTKKPALIDTSKITNQKILVFGAHPDDIEFASAGTILKLTGDESAKSEQASSFRNKIHFVIATDGSYGTHNANQNRQQLVQTRQAEARESAKKLGVQKISFWSYPDLGLSDRKKILLKKVVKILLKEKPNMVFSWDPWGKYEAYIHPDHRTLAWAVAEAVMLSTLPQWNYRHGLGKRYLQHKPQLWLYAPNEPNVAVDVSSTWQARIDAVKTFTSQFDQQVKWEKTKHWLTSSYSQQGQSVGVAYAETFRIMEYNHTWNLETNENI